MTCDARALDIVRHLRAAGFETYLVGGCVRDHLMGIAPKDWDIATEATPDQIQALFPRTVSVGKSFGVIIVVMPEDDYEVATFRSEGEYSDGRRPDRVSFGCARDDVKRRDFTMNALMADPLTGEVIDWVGGVDDIEAGLVRTVGDPHDRFAEDHLRLLRAVRFAARTGFAIETHTMEAIRRLAERVADVSGERTGDEITRILTEGGSHQGLTLLHESGLLPVLLPEIKALQGVPQPPEFHPEGDVWTHTLIMLAEWDRTVEAMPETWPPGWTGTAFEREVLGWATLLHDIGKPSTRTRTDRIRFHGHDQAGAELAEGLLRRLRRPKKVITAVCELIDRHMRFIHIHDMREAKRRRLVAEDLFPLHLELHRLDCLGSHAKLDGYEFGLEAYRREQSRPAPATPLIRGQNLIKAGYKPGPRMGDILRRVADARLEGEVNSPDEALDWVKDHFPVPK